MQFDPMKPKLKAPGPKCLTLKCDEQLSIFAFNFNLRRYIEVVFSVSGGGVKRVVGASAAGLTPFAPVVRRCRSTL